LSITFLISHTIEQKQKDKEAKTKIKNLVLREKVLRFEL
jgi:hypothetical protein